jgi:hypothetical protein
MMVDIHLCRLDEIELVMLFVHEHWAADHVLSWHRALMDFQHLGPDHYNFVVARRVTNGEMLGVLGFIPSQLYDEALADRNTIWLALWKIRPDAGVAGLGLMLLRFLESNQTHVAMAVAGIGNAALIGMYRALGYQAGEYQQHYMRNWRIVRPKLARFPDETVPPRPPDGDASIELLAPDYSAPAKDDFGLDPALDIDFGERAQQGPAKTTRYFARRFWAHPVYQYEIHLVRRSKRALGLLASRVASHRGHRALRIVDYLGNEEALGELGPAIDELLDRSRCEYADLWSYGIDAGVLARAGFRRVDPAGSVIVPNFFEPYALNNSVIRCAFKGPPGQRFVFFRADGDQDRPNETKRHRVSSGRFGSVAIPQ